jgi:hypothetical protein
MPNPFTQPTTAQSLGALLKSVRDIMRKDKGLIGDLDHLPTLTGRSSRREEALIDFGFHISDFGFFRMSLVTSAATKSGPAQPT